MNTDTTGEAMRDMVEKLLEDPSVREISVDEPLEGLIDSFALIELLGLLEQKHAIKFLNAHMTKENWVSFSAIGRLVDSLLKKPGAGGAAAR
jgi:acyl carrier protein